MTTKSIWIQKKIEEPLNFKLTQDSIEFSDYINQLIENDLRINLIKSKTYKNDCFKDTTFIIENCQKYLYRVFFKRWLRYEFFYEIAIKHLQQQKLKAERYSNSHPAIMWIDKQIELLKIGNIRDLDIDLERLNKNCIRNLKHEFGKEFIEEVLKEI